MKKICFVTTISGTLKSFVIKTATYLHEKGGYDISMICAPDEEFAKALPEYIHFFPVAMERGISLGGVRSMLEMYKIFKREKFDLVQYSTPNAACYASIAAKMAGVPVRLYCQWGLAYVGFSGCKRSVFRLIEKMVCTLSTRIEPDSFGNLQFSVQEGLYLKSKGAVIWNGSACGVDLSKFDHTKKARWRRETRMRLNIPQDAVVFGFVGRITGDKGINELFESAKEFLCHEDAWLILVGKPEKTDSVDPTLYQWAEDHERVLFCGYTSVVEQYLSAMDVYVLPSYREGFGSAVIEAEAMEVPVIVTDIPGPTDAMLRDETGLVVRKQDAQSLKSAMETLYADEEKRSFYGKCGLKFATEKFEQQKLFSYILADRDELLSNR